MKRALAAVACSLLVCACEAAEWAIDPRIESRASVTDNLNLTPNTREAVNWYTLTPAVVFSRNTESSRLAGSAQLGFNRFPDDETLNTTDQAYYLSGQQSSERNAYGGSLTHTRDSTLASELSTTGLVLERQQRTQNGISPFWTYALTERSSVTASYDYSQVSYEAGAGLDYVNQGASGGYQYVLSERTALTLTGAYSHFETDIGSTITDTYSLTAGITHDFGERLNLAFNIGGRRSDTETTQTVGECPVTPPTVCDAFPFLLVFRPVQTESSDTGLLLDANAGYRWQATTVNLGIGRDVNPSGNGVVVQTDRLSASLRHDFSEILSASFGSAYLRTRFLSNDGGDTDYFRLDSSLSWKLNEWWSLGGGYAFAWQKAKSAPSGATANTIFLSLGYNWPRISISR